MAARDVGTGDAAGTARTRRKVRLSLSLDREVHRKLRLFVAANETSATAVVTRWIEESC